MGSKIYSQVADLGEGDEYLSSGYVTIDEFADEEGKTPGSI